MNIDTAYISEEAIFELEGNEIGYSFSTTPDIKSHLPTDEQLYQKIRSIVLAKSPDFIYQELGIEPLKKAFNVSYRNFILFVPSSFKMHFTKGFVTLKYGDKEVPDEMFEIAKKSGMACYWDWDNIVFCAPRRYQPIVENIFRLFKSYRVRLELDPRNPELENKNRDLWIWKNQKKKA